MTDRFLKEYNGHIFEDWGAYCSKDFKSFARKFKNYLKRNLPGDEIIVKHGCGHYDLHGFVKHGNDCIYYNYNWDRYNPVDVHEDANLHKAVLVRYAKDENDYHGSKNEFCSIEQLPEYIAKMFARNRR